MNELDLVADLCEAVTPPDAERLARARARLTDATEAASQVTAPPPRKAARNRFPLGRAVGQGRGPGRTRIAVAIGLVVAVAAGLTTGLSLTGGAKAPLGAPASAAELLARVAAASAAQPVPRDNQFIYTEATGITLASMQPGSQKTVRYTTQTWSPVNGLMGDLVHQKPCQRVPGGPGGLGPLSCNFRISSGGGMWVPVPRHPGHYEPAPTIPQTYAAARSLPTSARQLDAYLKSVPTMGDRELVWNLLTRILEFVPVLPPKVAGAVFTLASEQPGVTLLPHVTDAAGQPGIGITKTGDPSHVELIFDPRTYQLEGINVPGFDLITPQGPVAGAHSMAIVHTAVVNSEPAG
jgi:hypothetical protein